MKNVTMRLLIVGILFSLLTACAAHTPFQNINPDEGKALVYVFRPNSPFARGEMMEVEANGAKQDLLLNNAYIPVQVTPGANTLKAQFKKRSLGKPTSMNLTTSAGETYYVKVEPGIAWTIKLSEIDPAQGAREISSKVLYQQ